MSLSDHIDLLNRNTKNIKAIAQSSPETVSFTAPFTHAILQSHLGDLIRDVDLSELGLFSLIQPDETTVHEKPVEIERVNFSGATPLRKPGLRREDKSHLRDDPDVYASAALKYLDRYKLVRPMPRAQAQIQAILERIPILKRTIEDLTDSLHQLEQTRTSSGLNYKSRLEDEEQHIRELRAKLAQLTQKRLALTKAKRSHLDLTESKSATPIPLAPSNSNPEEHEFWNTPGASTRAPTRAFKFSSDDLLMEQDVDFADMSTISFSASPAPSKMISNIFTDSTSGPPTGSLRQLSSGAPQDDILSRDSLDARVPELPLAPARSDPVGDTQPSNVSTGSSIPSPKKRDPSEARDMVVENAPKITITPEIEVIATKIWAVMGDLVIAAAAGKNVEFSGQPSTREIINCLAKMQKTTPSDGLSMASNDGPSLQQVLTASLLIGLLSSPSPHSLSLSKVKVLLAAHDAANSSQSNSSRIVYGCVAKRLLKIDRTGGEQIVAFDV